jgi:hypothetical protein
MPATATMNPAQDKSVRPFVPPAVDKSVRPFCPAVDEGVRPRCLPSSELVQTGACRRDDQDRDEEQDEQQVHAAAIDRGPRRLEVRGSALSGAPVRFAGVA